MCVMCMHGLPTRNCTGVCGYAHPVHVYWHPCDLLHRGTRRNGPYYELQLVARPVLRPALRPVLCRRPLRSSVLRRAHAWIDGRMHGSHLCTLWLLPAWVWRIT